jgi:ribosome-binding ATPase YchF (GTP1/OBG family)
LYFAQRAELHAWIFTNIRLKWAGLRRRAQSAVPSTADKNTSILERICDLLSGYHTTRSTVITSLQHAGIAVNFLCDSSVGVLSWNASRLHSFVAHFLRVRFPIVLALNKCDISSSFTFYERIRKELPHEPITRTSAAVEWWLQQQSHCVQIHDKTVACLSSGPGWLPLPAALMLFWMSCL